jgi:hypothetical protein
VAILLPACPLPNEAQPFLISFGGNLTPFLGGPVQHINRLGDRFGIRYVMPELDGEEARSYIARLLRGRNERVLIPWFRTVFDQPDEGAPKVASGVSGGMAVPITGVAGGYTTYEGQFLSIVHDGRRYMHMATGNLTGNGTLGIWPPLRTALNANDVVELADPMIEGLVSPGDEISWSHAIDLTTAISFSVVESK